MTYPDKREEYTKVGLAIINPYGGVWTDEIFETPEAALAYLKKFWKERRDFVGFKLAMATKTITVQRPPGKPTFIELPAEVAK